MHHLRRRFAGPAKRRTAQVPAHVHALPVSGTATWRHRCSHSEQTAQTRITRRPMPQEMHTCRHRRRRHRRRLRHHPHPRHRHQIDELHVQLRQVCEHWHLRSQSRRRHRHRRRRRRRPRHPRRPRRRPPHRRRPPPHHRQPSPRLVSKFRAESTKHFAGQPDQSILQVVPPHRADDGHQASKRQSQELQQCKPWPHVASTSDEWVLPPRRRRHRHRHHPLHQTPHSMRQRR
mmetsp:Transcript_6189/g.14069  ORF Transcript_6189/g.14069 Transcript_6189/m.14069 type:complete len:232 (+) Transcript_6189:72-767(+)